MAANVAAPSGFQTLRRADGAVPNYAHRQNIIAPAYATRINYGDPVILFTDGTIRLYTAAATTIHGIFRGCRYLDPNSLKTEFRRFWPGTAITAGTTVFADVDADPNMTFMAQVAGVALTVSAIGQNMDITAATSGTSTNITGISTCTLSGTAANTATLPFRIFGIVGLAGGTATPAINAAYNPLNDNQWLEVVMNTPDLTTRTGQA
jgi:phage tail sheath gpL-like